MSDIKSKVQGLEPSLQPRDLHEMVEKTNNIYETIAIISKRARLLANDIKHELHDKLEEFAVNPETIEEITENKEQIEISKFYERLPNPALIATNEFLEGELHYEFKNNK